MRNSRSIVNLLLSLLLVTAVSPLHADAWTQQSPATSPSARWFTVSAPVSGTDQIVLFGGYPGTENGETWVYDVSLDSWTQKTPAGSVPSPRYAHAMVGLAGTDQVFLFGGYDGAPDGESWIYDLSANAWTQLSPSGGSPSARNSHKMAGISGTDKVLLFGGGGTALSSETWIYDVSENSWTQMSPAGSVPSARGNHAMAEIPGTDQVLLFGGGTFLNDTWIYDLSDNTWTQKSPAGSIPPERWTHGLVPLGSTDRILMFGGAVSGIYRGDTWIYDVSDDTWTQSSPVTSPSARQGFAMSNVSGTGQVVIFGGYKAEGMTAETWIYEADAPPPPSCAPQLGVPVAYTAGSNPIALAIGDFNGDDVPDIATANRGSANVTVMTGVGDGTFTATATLGPVAGPYNITAADFDQDGDLDLATANNDGSSVTIFLGQGDGSFTLGSTFPVAAAPNSVVAASLNDDGYPDLVVTTPATNSASIFLGSGGGVFAAGATLSGMSWPEGTVVADLNGDGLLDVVATNYGLGGGSTVSRFLGNGDGTFGARVDYAAGGGGIVGPSVGDFNGDGKLDVAAVSHFGASLVVLLGDGTGAFAAPVGYAVGSRPVFTDSADLDLDGDLDLVVANRDAANSLTLYFGNGDGTFAGRTDLVGGTGPYWVKAVDLDDDGALDLAVADWRGSNVLILMNGAACNTAPVLDAIGDRSVAEGESLTFTVSASDGEGNTLTYAADGLPAGANFNPATREFSWTPGYDAAAASPYVVTFTVTDGSAEDEETIEISVTNTNRPPVLDPIGDRSAVEGVPLTFTISGSDPDDDPTWFVLGSHPGGATFNPTTREFSWTPPVGSSSSSPFVASFFVSDSLGPDDQPVISSEHAAGETIAITVGTNQPPVLDAIGDRTTAAGSNLSISLSADDPEDAPLTYTAVGLPSGASLDSETGEFNWTPANAQGGVHEVTFKVSDGVSEDEETITVTVTVPGLTGTSFTVHFDVYNQGRANALPSHVRAVLSDHGDLTDHELGTGKDVELTPQRVAGPECSGDRCTPALGQGETAGYEAIASVPPGGFGRYSIDTVAPNGAEENEDGSFTLTANVSTDSIVSWLPGRYLWIEADSARDGEGEKLDEAQQVHPMLLANDAQAVLVAAAVPTFGELTHLSAVFESLAGGSGEGTPRLEVYLQGHGKLAIRLGHAPAFSDTNAALEDYSWFNLIGNADAGRFDTSGLTGVAPELIASSTDYATALAAGGSFTISRIDFVADAEGSSPYRSYRLERINVGVGPVGAALAPPVR